MKHKWHKEIKAWADGAEIEWRFFKGDFEWTNWRSTEKPPKEWNVKLKGEYKFDGDFSTFNDDRFELRIKPQPKEPQYLYVISDNCGNIRITKDKDDVDNLDNSFDSAYIGKIKLEVDDE